MKRLPLILAMLVLVSCKKDKVKEEARIVEFQKTYPKVYSKLPGGPIWVRDSDYSYDITVWQDSALFRNTIKSTGQIINYYAKRQGANKAYISGTNGWATVIIYFFEDSLHLSLIPPGTLDSEESYGKP